MACLLCKKKGIANNGKAKSFTEVKSYKEKAKEYQNEVSLYFINYYNSNKPLTCQSQQAMESAQKHKNSRPFYCPCEKLIYRSGSHSRGRIWGKLSFSLAHKYDKATYFPVFIQPLCQIYTVTREGTLEEDDHGFNTEVRHINNLHHADDMTLIAENRKNLQALVLKIKEQQERMSQKLNLKKTKQRTTGRITGLKLTMKISK